MNVGVLYNTIKSSKNFHVEDDIEDMAKDIISSLEKENYVTALSSDNKLLQNIKKSNLDMIFNICERFKDNSMYEPHVAAMLEMSGIPFTGSGPLTLFLCNDKIRSKDILINNKVLTPNYQVFDDHNKDLDQSLDFPLIVKPRQQENSIGITKDSVVKDIESLRNKVKEVNEKYKQEALVEEFISGKDIEVGIIGNGEDIIVLPIAKVTYKNMKGDDCDNIFCYESKWDIKSECYGDYEKAELNDCVKDELKKTALKVFKIFNIKDYGRIDFRLTDDNQAYVIEVTANPGLSKVCSTPQSASWGNISYSELINKILNHAKKRWNR